MAAQSQFVLQQQACDTQWRVPAKAPRMFPWGFTASKWDIQFFLSMVSILGLRGYFYILAKSPDCIICYCGYKWMNLCKPWTFYTWLEPTCAHKSLVIRNDSDTLGMVFTPVTQLSGAEAGRSWVPGQSEIDWDLAQETKWEQGKQKTYSPTWATLEFPKSRWGRGIQILKYKQKLYYYLQCFLLFFINHSNKRFLVTAQSKLPLGCSLFPRESPKSGNPTVLACFLSL